MLSQQSPKPPAGPPGTRERDEDRKPRILLLGQRRSGKSSISNVVFHKMPPQESLFLPSTSKICKENMHSFMDFQVWDFPGQLDFMDPAFDSSTIFPAVGSVIWVIDAQDNLFPALNRLHSTILHCDQFYPGINLEIFIHKVDGLSQESKIDIRRDIMDKLEDQLSDSGFDDIKLNWHLTSIYDNSIFEAFSKVLNKLVPELGSIIKLLDVLEKSSAMSKVYIIDVLSKIFVATNSQEDDGQSYQLASDFVDMVIDCNSTFAENAAERGEAQQPASSEMSDDDEHDEDEEDTRRGRSPAQSLSVEQPPLTSSLIFEPHDGRMIYMHEMNR